MESIGELREICEKRHKKGVSKQHWWAVLFARRVSIYFVWFILKYSNISANQVTIYQLISSIIGFTLLCFQNIWVALLGVLFLHLGYIFDCADGEVARYRKTQSINGMFLDFINHVVMAPMIFSCLAFHYYFLLNDLFYFGLGIAIIILKIPSIGSARHYAINYLIVKRQSPSYDVSKYKLNSQKKVSAKSPELKDHNRIKNVLKKVKKIFGEAFSYPNDVIIISALILIELITNSSIYGRVILILFTLYFTFSFILEIYIHIKNKIPERDFFEYIQAALEIVDKMNSKKK